MAKQAEEINIRSRARRRLIGAVALALAVVVILPMVLDSEPKTTGQDIDLRIPAADKVGAFVPGEAISEVVEAASLAESAVAPASAVASQTVVAAVKPATQTDVKPEAKPEVKVQVMADTGAAEVKKPEVKPTETKKPEARISEIKRAEVNQAEAQVFEKSAGNYIVQVGAFSNAETATQEAAKLKGWGFKSYTELISGTTRVRVGPYVDRGKADEVRKLLEKHGLHPVIAEVNGSVRQAQDRQGK